MPSCLMWSDLMVMVYAILFNVVRLDGYGLCHPVFIKCSKVDLPSVNHHSMSYIMLYKWLGQSGKCAQ